MERFRLSMNQEPLKGRTWERNRSRRRDSVNWFNNGDKGCSSYCQGFVSSTGGAETRNHGDFGRRSHEEEWDYVTGGYSNHINFDHLDCKGCGALPSLWNKGSGGDGIRTNLSLGVLCVGADGRNHCHWHLGDGPREMYSSIGSSLPSTGASRAGHESQVVQNRVG